MDIINEKIKELYNNDKALFSEKINVIPKNLSKRIKTIQNKIEYVNDILKHLDLELVIKEKENIQPQ